MILQKTSPIRMRPSSQKRRPRPCCCGLALALAVSACMLKCVDATYYKCPDTSWTLGGGGNTTRACYKYFSVSNGVADVVAGTNLCIQKATGGTLASIRDTAQASVVLGYRGTYCGDFFPGDSTQFGFLVQYIFGATCTGAQCATNSSEWTWTNGADPALLQSGYLFGQANTTFYELPGWYSGSVENLQSGIGAVRGAFPANVHGWWALQVISTRGVCCETVAVPSSDSQTPSETPTLSPTPSQSPSSASASQSASQTASFIQNEPFYTEEFATDYGPYTGPVYTTGVAVAADGACVAISSVVTRLASGSSAAAAGVSIPGKLFVLACSEDPALGCPISYSTSDMSTDGVAQGVGVSAGCSRVAAGAAGGSARPGGGVFVLSCIAKLGGSPYYACTEEGILGGSNTGDDASLGTSVAVTPDGEWVYAGAPGRNASQGSAYVWDCRADSFSNCVQFARIDPPADGAQGFGQVIAVSPDGSALVVTAALTRIVYVYSRRNAGMPYVLTGSISDSIETDFGKAIAVGADTSWVAVGAPSHDNAKGCVFLYNCSTTTACAAGPVKVLRPFNPVANEQFGSSVAIRADGSAIAVGAPYRKYGALVMFGCFPAPPAAGSCGGTYDRATAGRTLLPAPAACKERAVAIPPYRFYQALGHSISLAVFANATLAVGGGEHTFWSTTGGDENLDVFSGFFAGVPWAPAELDPGAPWLTQGGGSRHADWAVNATGPISSTISIVWQFRASAGTSLSSISVGTCGSTLFVGGSDGILRALSTVTGALVWQYDAGPLEFGTMVRSQICGEQTGVCPLASPFCHAAVLPDPRLQWPCVCWRHI